MYVFIVYISCILVSLFATNHSACHVDYFGPFMSVSVTETWSYCVMIVSLIKIIVCCKHLWLSHTK
jgi:hypothetical protein